MAFWKKSNDKKKEMEEIKNKIEGNNPMPAPPPPQVPSQVSVPPSIPEPPREVSAPLFVKIDKYEDVLKKLNELKSSLKTLTRLISFSNEVDDLKTDIKNRIKNSTAKLTDTLISLDEVFIEPGKTRIDIHRDAQSGVEEQVYDLEEELKHLRKEIAQIK